MLLEGIELGWGGQHSSAQPLGLNSIDMLLGVLMLNPQH